MSITVQDAQTGADLTVQEVRAAAARASRDDRTPRERKLENEMVRLAHENTQLRKQLGGWTPTRDWRTITGAADLTKRQHDAALVAPTVEQLRNDDTPLAAELVAGVDRKAGWPVWLDEFHHLQRVDTERWAPLHAMLAESEARTGTPEPPSEPNGWAWAEYHAPAPQPYNGPGATLTDYFDAMDAADQAGVSSEGEAFLEQGPAPDESMAGRTEAGPPPQDADAAQRTKVLAQAAQGERRELQPATEDPPEPDGYVSDTWWAQALAWISGRKRGL